MWIEFEKSILNSAAQIVFGQQMRIRRLLVKYPIDVMAMVIQHMTIISATYLKLKANHDIRKQNMGYNEETETL